MREKSRRKKNSSIHYFDYNLLFIIIFLVGFGLVMLYSTSSYVASIRFGSSTFYLKNQAKAVALGVVGMLVVSKIDYHIWQKLSGAAYFSALALCIAVLFAGEKYNGSTRWLKIGSFSFQPSELAKFATILILATTICKLMKHLSKVRVLVVVLILVFPLIFAIGVNNLSTAIIVMGIAVCMMFVSSPKYSHFIFLFLGIGVCAIAFILMEGYRAERIKIWLDPESFDKGYQTLQGLYAIGSGGLFGKGLGESVQKLGSLPEAQNDMIFSIICEELGIFGAICVIMLFLLMIWRFMVIANNAKDLFGSLIVVGIMAHIAIQVVLNIAVVTNSIPNTGITLPFISYGGTSVTILLGEMGVALNVSRAIEFEPLAKEKG